MKTTRMAPRLIRFAVPVVMGLALVVGLLWVLAPRSVVEAQDPPPGLDVDVTREEGRTPSLAPLSAPPLASRMPGSGLSRVDEAAVPGGGARRSRTVDPDVRSTADPFEPQLRLVKNPDYYDAASVVVTEVTSIEVVSTLSVLVRSQVEYDDPSLGFQRAEGVNEYVFDVSEVREK